MAAEANEYLEGLELSLVSKRFGEGLLGDSGREGGAVFVGLRAGESPVRVVKRQLTADLVRQNSPPGGEVGDFFFSREPLSLLWLRFILYFHFSPLSAIQFRKWPN